MADLRIRVAALSSTVTANDSKAANVLTNVADYLNLTGTNAEKLDGIAEYLRQHLTELSKRQARGSGRVTSDTAVAADDTINFED